MSDRAVSELLGFMMVVAIVVGTLALLQVAAVPQWNENVESDHADELRSDMTELHGAIVATSTTGGERAVPISLGTSYSGGGLLLRPPPSTGTLRTESGRLGIENAAAPTSPETDDFLEGGRTYDTRLVAYQPQYAQYNGPVTRYEHAVFAERHGDGTIVRAGDVVDGRTVRLVSLSGNLSESGASRTNVPVVGESVSTRSVTVTGRDGGPISIRLSTALDRSVWESTLADEPYASVTAHDGETVTIALAGDQRYRLKLARVHLGDGPTAPTTEYAAVSGDREVRPGETATVEARDRFTNPVSGAEVRVEGCGNDAIRTADDAGQVSLRCDSPTTFTVTVPETNASTQVFVGGVDGDTVSPQVSNAASSVTTETYRTATAGTTTQSQARVSYTAADDDSGVARVGLRLQDSTGDVVTATTHTFDGEASVSNVWQTPWLTGNLAGYTVRLRVVDVAGNVHTCQLSVRGEGCV